MKSFEFSQSLPVLGLTFILTFPVHGCESLQYTDGSFTAAETVPVKMAVHSKTSMHGRNMDMLVFVDDKIKYLECWQRVQMSETGEVSIASMNGPKIMMACSGIEGKGHEDWMWVSSIESLQDAWTELEDETSDMPVLSGSCSFRAGGNDREQPRLTLRRVSSEVFLRSLKCDFKGRAYEGEKLSDIQVYLTNVNASCRIWDDLGTASRIINQGRLVMEDIARFKDQSLIWQSIEGNVCEKGINPDIRLRCYPNTASKEGPGTPFTRLVIQGVLDGDTWYWPIDINQDNGSSQPGIGSNCIYAFDIVLTRKGSADPDTAIKTGTASITMEVKQWEEKEDYTVGF